MQSDRSQANDNERRVIPLRRPKAAASRRPGWRWPLRASESATPPAQGLGKYEGADHDDDNYRHRMMVNLAALAFTALLSVVGVWLVTQIADMRKNQDCVLSGRRNCSPIEVDLLDR